MIKPSLLFSNFGCSISNGPPLRLFVSHWLLSKRMMLIIKSLQDIWQNHWPIKYRSCWPTFIRSTVGANWLIIPKYEVHLSNSLQHTMATHWTAKYMSCWPTSILRLKFMSHWLINQSMMYTHQIAFKIYGKITGPSNIDYWYLNLFWGQRSHHNLQWLIIPKHVIHPSNPIQNIRQNHWTITVTYIYFEVKGYITLTH